MALGLGKEHDSKKLYADSAYDTQEFRRPFLNGKRPKSP
jgi:hypothetical protein